ncbi:MAG TPA: hypothetical protein VGL75_07365 [Acidothermaceae bacterium]|jgi:hypothetical protein
MQLNVGNFLEIVGACLGIWGTYLIAGFAVMLLVACVSLVLLAEFVFDASVIPLPSRKPRTKDDGNTTVRYKP